MLKRVIVLFFFLALIPYQGYSQSFGLDTVRIYEDIEAGKSLEKIIQVTYTAGDNEGKPVQVIVSTADWQHNDVTQQPDLFPANTRPNSCAAWLSFSPQSFILSKDNKVVKVLVSINVPAHLDYPEYNAMLFFSNSKEPDPNTDKVGFSVETRMAVVVKLNDKAQAIVDGEVKSFDFVKNEEEDGYDLIFQIKNTGNVLLFINGTFNVIDDEGSLYGRGVIERIPISPGVTSTVIQTWYGELSPGEFDVVSTVEIGSKENIDILEKHVVIE
ncbi:MAG: hypothetical protein JW928_08015 [Candidatus Aureabacteria bacterium]|nr:hypothetical protein [Candidatus Auribacterota bacterium]